MNPSSQARYYATELARLEAELERAEFDFVRRTSTGTQPMRSFVHENVGFEFTWVERGSVEFQIGPHKLTASAGSCVLLPPRIEHAAVGWRGTAYQLTLATGLVQAAAESLGGAARVPSDGIVLTCAERLPQLASVLVGDLRDGLEGDDPGVRALVHALAVAAVRKEAPPARLRRVDRRISRAVERIRVDFASDLSVDVLAAEAQMSRFAFLRTFRAQVGESPYQHLLSVRLSHAARLLVGSRRPVLSIALSCGFGDPGRFARQFRSRFGCLPSEYRRSPR